PAVGSFDRSRTEPRLREADWGGSAGDPGNSSGDEARAARRMEKVQERNHVMKSLSRNILGLTAVIAGFGATAAWADSAASIDGRWDATLTVNGAAIPFRLDISGDGATLKGTLYNGDDKEYTTSASFKDGKLALSQEHYLTRITATLKDGQLVGFVHLHGGGGEQGPEGNGFEAKRHVDVAAAPAGNAPNIAGNW